MTHQLLNKGYYVGKIAEIVDDLSAFDNFSNELISLSNANRSKYYMYRHNVDHGYPKLENRIELWEIPKRKKLVDDNKLHVFQQWCESMRDPNGELNHIRDFFRNVTESTVFKIYPELNSNNVYHTDSFTIFENGDFILDHTDGENIGRLCVILIYLSDPATYNDGGGNLVITDQSNHQTTEAVVPVRGNYTLIDFTKHNIRHKVEVVKNNFQRFCYINFIYNSDLTIKNK